MGLKNSSLVIQGLMLQTLPAKLAVDLQQEGFNVWIDQQDIRAGN